MKLWLLRQEQREGYDTYDSAIVAAETEDQARRIHPSDSYEYSEAKKCFGYKDSSWNFNDDSWAKDIELITVSEIGEANPDLPAGVVLASFNAG